MEHTLPHFLVACFLLLLSVTGGAARIVPAVDLSTTGLPTTTGETTTATLPQTTATTTAEETTLPTTVPTTVTTPKADSGGVDVGAIVGGAIAGLIVAVATCIVVFFCVKSYRSHGNCGAIIGVCMAGVTWVVTKVTGLCNRCPCCKERDGFDEIEGPPPSGPGDYDKDKKAGSTNATPPNDYEIDPTSGRRPKSDIEIKEIRASDVKKLKPLGSGFYGEVWKAEVTGLTTGNKITMAAVKQLKANATDQVIKEMEDEIELMTQLPKHENIVTILGYSIKDHLLVMELMPGGSLKKVLDAQQVKLDNGDTDGILTPRDLLLMAKQIASAMQHLADFGYIHRDLAARNVLVNDENVCKLADFGLARDIAEDDMYETKTQRPLPTRWMAPESMKKRQFTTESDVWAYGVTLWEIITLGDVPFGALSGQEIYTTVTKGGTLENPEDDRCPANVYDIMKECWQMKPKDRPTFEDLVHLLEEEIEAIDHPYEFVSGSEGENSDKGSEQGDVNSTSPVLSKKTNSNSES